MTPGRPRAGDTNQETPWQLDDDEVNRWLALRFRTCADLAFTRGEEPQ